MTNENPCYRKGSLWKTRTKLKATPDNMVSRFNAGKPTEITIPTGEIVMLLFYEMNIDYEENIAFLWKEQVYFAFEIDTGFTFDLDPNGVNTGSNNV